ncbi:hypothetical protein WDZ11_14885 [Roseomonas mucosa]|uniref:hypothetical protein n=1 Tax=Roseomonas mucosa TaxID=207340 RepID=UPI0030D138FC
MSHDFQVGRAYPAGPIASAASVAMQPDTAGRYPWDKMPVWPPVPSEPPADFWDRVAREVAKLMVAQQGAARS